MKVRAGLCSTPDPRLPELDSNPRAAELTALVRPPCRLGPLFFSYRLWDRGRAQWVLLHSKALRAIVEEATGWITMTNAVIMGIEDRKTMLPQNHPVHLGGCYVGLANPVRQDEA
jgi:hypothetical protein